MDKKSRKQTSPSQPPESVETRSATPPSMEHLTPKERAIALELWEREQREEERRRNEPTSKDYAEALGLSKAAAEKLLQEENARKAKAQKVRSTTIRAGMAACAAIALIPVYVKAIAPWKTTNEAAAHAEKGHDLEDRGKLSASESELRMAVRLAPTNRVYRRSLAEVYYRDENWPSAEAEYRSLAQIEPSNELYQFRWGNSLFNQHRYVEAIDRYRAAIKLNPRNDAYQSNLGESLIHTGQFEEAEASIREAMRLAPNVERYTSDLGDALAGQKRMKAAEEEYREAIRLAPDSLGHRAELAAFLVKLGRWPDAEKLYQQLAAAAPGTAEYHERLGFVLYNRTELPEAIEQLRAALYYDPKNAEYRGELGRAIYLQYALGLTRQLSPAEDAYREATRLDPNSPSYLNSLAYVLDTEGKASEALTVLRDSANLDPNNPVTHFMLGFMHLHHGKFADAEAEYGQAVRIAEHDGKSVTVADSHASALLPSGTYYSGLASALLKQGKHDAALKIVNQAIAHGVDKQAIKRELGLKTGSTP